MKRSLLVLIIVLISINIVNAANLSGTIYDSSLNIVSKAIIEINPPLQRYITNDGKYYFGISPGAYNITISYSDGSKKEVLSELVIIEEDNREYIYDIFVFEDLSEEENLSSEEIPEIIVDEIQKKSYLSEILMLSTVLFVFLILWLLKKENKKLNDTEVLEIQSDKNKIIRVLKDNQGSMTQKELRKQIPYSEAKISLWITELESEDKIKKIRKGRGNILVLKND